MSSPALSDSKVLHAFRTAYNDKFRELMKASDPVPSLVPSGCSACLVEPRPTMVEVAEAPRPRVVAKSSDSFSCSNARDIWTVVLVLAGLALLFVLGSQICKMFHAKPKKVVLAGTALSVEVSMEGSDKAVKDVSDPSQAVPTSGRAIVMYHATWCGHCKQMRPLYESAVATAAASPKLAFLACEHEVLESSGKGKQLGIQGYPTLVAFESGYKKGELVGNVGTDKLKAFIAQYGGE
jgi:thiol-disulfide isomerase/thioredoxin